MPPVTGYSSTFPTDVVLDSGVLYIGATVLGATRGGLKFDPAVELRNIPFDGQRSAVKGLDRKTKVTPKLSGTLIELTPADVPTIDSGASVVAAGAYAGSTSYQGKAAGSLYAAGDYLTDVRAVWLRGNGQYVQVRFPSALVTKFDMAGQDGDEVMINLEIEARLDMTASGASVGDMPYRIEYLATGP